MRATGHTPPGSVWIDMSTPSDSPQVGVRRHNFDLLRILVAVLVLFNHTTLYLKLDKQCPRLISFFPGVPIFFVISGFLVSRSYETGRSLGSYARNRLLRIFPGLWVCVLLTIPVATYFGHDFLHVRGLAWLVTQLGGAIYTPGFLKGFGFGSYNGSLWTIPLVLQFYVLLPVSYYVLSRPGDLTRGLVALWGLFVVLALIFRPMTVFIDGQPDPLDLRKLLRYTFVPHFYLFLFGVLLQRFRAHESSLIKGRAPIWLAAYIALMYVIPDSDVKYVLHPLALGLVVLSAACTGPDLARLVFRGNDLSYGVYIYHGLVINVFVELGLVGSPAYAWIVTAVTFALAWLSWKLVERPLLRKKRQSIRQLPVPVGNSAV
jgi:peptidoglycan/LPS O-acetylase OafA/YrhL